MTVSFKIVENYSHEHKFEDFREDFLQGKLKVLELRKKYEIGQSTYREWRERIYNEVEGSKIVFDRKFSYKRFSKKKPKQHKEFVGGYCKALTNGRVTIFKSKTKTHNQMSFGTYPNMKTAQKVFRQLLDNDWDIDLAEELLFTYAVQDSKRCLGRKIRSREE